MKRFAWLLVLPYIVAWDYKFVPRQCPSTLNPYTQEMETEDCHKTVHRKRYFATLSEANIFYAKGKREDIWNLTISKDGKILRNQVEDDRVEEEQLNKEYLANQEKFDEQMEK